MKLHTSYFGDNFLTSMRINTLLLYTAITTYMYIDIVKVTSQSGYSTFRVHWTGEYIL